jgi:hypothetical protein
LQVPAIPTCHIEITNMSRSMQRKLTKKKSTSLMDKFNHNKTAMQLIITKNTECWSINSTMAESEM